MSRLQLDRLRRLGQVEETDRIRRGDGPWITISELDSYVEPAEKPLVVEAENGSSGHDPGPTETHPRQMRMVWIVVPALLTGLAIGGVFMKMSGRRRPGSGGTTTVTDEGGEVAVASSDRDDAAVKTGLPGESRAPVAKTVPSDQPQAPVAEKGQEADPKAAGQGSENAKTAAGEDSPAAPGARRTRGEDALPGKNKQAKKATRPPGRRYVVTCFYDLQRSRRSTRHRLKLKDLPGGPQSLDQITDLSLVGVELMDDLIEIEAGDDGRSLLIKGDAPAEDPCGSAPGRRVSVVDFQIGANGLGCRWSSSRDVVNRFLPQLQWCALSLTVAGGKTHFVALCRPVQQKPLPKLNFVEKAYRLGLPLDQVGEKVLRQVVIDGGRVDIAGRAASRIVAEESVDGRVSYILDNARRYQADRAEVDLFIEQEEAGEEERKRSFLRIRLEPEWEDLRDDLRDDREDLMRDNSNARLVGAIARKSGGKRLAMNANDGVRSFVEDRLKLQWPGPDADAGELASFGRKVVQESRKAGVTIASRLVELKKQERQLDSNRKQLVGATVRFRLMTRMRHLGIDVLVPRLSL